MVKSFCFLGVVLLVTASSCNNKVHQNNTGMSQENMHSENPYYSRTDKSKIKVSDKEWKKILPPELYAVAREQGTEYAFTGKYWNSEEKGTYYCAVCGNKLFRSDAKFASMCGWPSFFEAVGENTVTYKDDHSHGMYRIEVECSRCDSHLGHIFDDGPAPT
jgi:peptide-methionine (R)-S-oxide reductase